MKTSFIILLSLISIVLAKDISQWLEQQQIEAENDDEVGIAYQGFGNPQMFPAPDQNGVIQGPDFKLQLNSNGMESMPLGYFNNMPNSMMGMPNMMRPNTNMMGPNMNSMGPNFMSMYQGQNQGMTNNCGCSSSCGMPCLWWSCPCIPCPPCQTTQAPDNAPPVEPTTTTQSTTTSTTTASTTTVPIAVPTIPPQGCRPCQCNPCQIWWMCPPCGCNNGCQTSPPVQTTTPPANNCPCICAPCSNWWNCAPCPSNCPCNA